MTLYKRKLRADLTIGRIGLRGNRAPFLSVEPSEARRSHGHHHSNAESVHHLPISSRPLGIGQNGRQSFLVVIVGLGLNRRLRANL